MQVVSRRLRIVLASIAVVGLAAGCTSKPPTTVAGWAKRIPTLKRPAEVKKATNSLKRLALKQLKAGKDLKGDVPALLPLLKQDPVVRGPAAYLLGEIGDKRAVSPLIDAIDYSAAVADKEASRANGQIAQALGRLGDTQAMPALLKLSRSRDSFTALAAVEALGHAGGKDAVKPLADLVENPGVDNFIVKHAIVALGNIQDPSAMPVLVKALFMERGGVSFYRETSFALFQLGDAAVPTLVQILAGKDAQLMKWAKDKGIYDAAIYAKSAQLLGDLADRRADGALMKRLGYKNEEAQLELAVRMQAAQSLGRLRARKAARDIEKMLGEEDVTARDTYAKALVLMGERGAIPALEKSALTGQGYPARQDAQESLARLGGAADLARYDAVTKKNNLLKVCTNWFQGDQKAIAKNCRNLIKTYDDDVTRYRPMLVAAQKCKRDAACWAGKLTDKNGRVREKAAWELGMIRDPKTLGALLAAVKDDDLEAKWAEMQAIEQLLFGDDTKTPAPATAKEVADRLDALLKVESQQSHFVKADEDVKRLALRARRAAGGAGSAKTAAK